jgi:hypothetical protein
MEKGTDIETVRELLGHSTFQVTQKYTHSNDERKREAVEQLSRNEEKEPKLLQICYKNFRENQVSCLFAMN